MYEEKGLGSEYNALMSALQVSVSKHLLDACYTMVWGNDYYYKIIGYPKAEYEERFQNNPELYYRRHGYMEELGEIRETTVRALTRGEPGFSVITRMPVKGGGHLWVRMTGTFIDEYVGGKQVSYTVITNIDDLVRMRMDQSITYNNMPGFVAKFLVGDHLNLRLLDANNRFEEFFGKKEQIDSANALFQKNMAVNRAAIEAQYPNAMAGKPLQFLAKMENRAGQVAWLRVSGECVDWMGGFPVYLLIYIDVTDLTDLREMHGRLEEQAERLRGALEEAERANRAKSDFLSRMSHDIRTPMNAITGMTEIASAHLDDREKVRGCLRKIAASSQHLLGLINDVLDMSKIESGQMALRNDTMLLPETLESVIAIVQPMLKLRGQQFRVRLHNVSHEQFCCDALRLRQVFINILSNASKFTPENGSVTIDVEETPCDRPGTARLCFTFTDTGIGIQPEFMDRIFDAFAREKDTRVDKTEGTGLGMAITKRIVELMGGTITVQSEWGGGTAFTVCLPLQIEEAPQGEWSLPGLRVLVADDDEVLCEYTAQLLGECGVEARSVNSGMEAVAEVERAHRCGERYDAVIVDWKMPGMDGVKTVQKIRGLAGGGVPILITSAYDWDEIEAEARAAGASGFLPKPLFRSTICRGLSQSVLHRADAERERGRERSADLSGVNILLVEDNELNREIAGELLRDAGASVTFACDGAAGVEAFRSSPPHEFRLVLMDIQMPVMDGYTAARAIRALPRGDAAVPILAMTADAFAEDVAAAKEAGMNGHIAKPLDLADLKKKIHKALLQFP